MSSRTRRALPLALLLVAAVSASGVDWGSFVAASDRRNDEMILSALRDADFETSAEICKAVGSRSDPYAADILSWLLAGFAGTGEYRSEYLLRLAMSSLFDAPRGDPAMNARISANAAVLDDMVKTISRFQDPQLKGIIVRLLPRLESAGRLSVLMEVGAGIIGHLQLSEGHLAPPDRGLALDYLAVVQDIGTGDFLEQTLAIAGVSRDAGLVQKARDASRLLASRQR